MKWLKNRARFYLSCNFSCTLYFLVKIKVKLKNLLTSACLNLKLWHKKTNQKCKGCKKGEFIKTCDQYPCKFIFGHFFSSVVLPPFLLGKNIFSKNIVLGKWESGDQFFNSQMYQMYFPVILTP